jgi:phosphoglycolate phosphatase-like HAD superfamily hydrolase
MRYRLVIFDFDGTLADSFPWFLRSIDSVADRFRFRRLREGDVELLRGHGAREIIRYLGIPTWKLPFIARHMRRLKARDRDAEAARAVGIPFGAVAWGYSTPEALRSLRPAALFTRMEEIGHVVAGAARRP